MRFKLFVRTTVKLAISDAISICPSIKGRCSSWSCMKDVLNKNDVHVYLLFYIIVLRCFAKERCLRAREGERETSSFPFCE